MKWAKRIGVGVLSGPNGKIAAAQFHAPPQEVAGWMEAEALFTQLEKSHAIANGG